MLKQYKRPLNDKEKSDLQYWVNLHKKNIGPQKFRGDLKAALITVGILSALGITVSHFESNNAPEGWNLIIMLGFMAFMGFLMACFMYLPERRKSLKYMNAHQRILDRNEADVTHCKTDMVIELEEYEDLGPVYIFQIEPGKLLCLSGQQLYGEKNFPNSDFEIATARDPETGWQLLYALNRIGSKLKPLFTIPVQGRDAMPPELGYPQEDLLVTSGNIEDFRQYLKAA